MKEKGFTLAEMLIALALIGVIAALLIPKLLSSVGNRQDVAKVRANVSAIERALANGMSDPDANRGVTFAAMLAAQIPQGTAPAATALGCVLTNPFYFPDGSMFSIPVSANNMSETTATGTICIDLNTQVPGGTVYSGSLVNNGVAGVGNRYSINWATVPATSVAVAGTGAATVVGASTLLY